MTRKNKKLTRKQRRMIKWYIVAFLWGLAALTLLVVGALIRMNSPLSLINPSPVYASSPLSSNNENSAPGRLAVSRGEDLQVDAWVDQYSRLYGKTLGEQNHTRELLHCLLYNEAGYGSNGGHGDGGLASGPLQYHQATWIEYREKMMDEGLIKSTGSRDDMEQAIQTTAWAILHGHANAWGPVVRGYCQ